MGETACADVPQELEEAIKRARATQRRMRKREGVLHYIWQHAGDAPNRNSVRKLVDLMIETQEAGNFKQSSMVQEIFAFFERHKSCDAHSLVVATAIPVLEESLKTLYNHECRKDGKYDFVRFWQRYSPTAHRFFFAE